METILEKLTPGAFFEVSTENSWWQLTDHMKMDIGDYRYAVCVTSGQVKRFSVDQLVKKVSLSIYRT